MDLNIEKHWHAEAPEDTLDELNSSIEGLSAEEAARRLKEYGPNELEKEE